MDKLKISTCLGAILNVGSIQAVFINQQLYEDLDNLYFCLSAFKCRIQAQ